MKGLKAVAAMVAIAVPTLVAPSTVQAGDGGAVAAGVAGGLIGGMFLGSALAPRPYYAPAPCMLNHRPITVIGLAAARIGTTGGAFGFVQAFEYANSL